MKRKLLSAAMVVLLSTTSLAIATTAHAGTGSATTPDKNASIKVTISDKVAGSRPFQPVKVQVITPNPDVDVDGKSHNHSLSLSVEYSGNSCFLNGSGNYQFYNNVDQNSTFKLDWLALVPNRVVTGKPGLCKATAHAKIFSSLWSSPTWQKNVIATTTFRVRANPHLSKPSAVSKVKKGKTVTLKGTATYKYMKSTYGTATKETVDKGTKITLQQRVAGSKKWKSVKTIKVGSSGKWSTKVKPSKTTQYRVTMKRTSKYLAKTSSVKKVTVTKK